MLYVPEISQNLFSVAQMLEKGYSLHFEKMSCIIHDPTGDHLMTVAMKDKSFPIDWKQIPMHAYASSVDDSCLWHKRFGHFSYSTLKQKHEKILVADLPAINDVVHV